MNIRLAGELPNYFAKELESRFDKEGYTEHNQTTMVSNNKRSSKEYEKDLSYSFGSNTVNAVVDYPSGQSRQSHSSVTRLTRSTADLSEYNQPKDQFSKDSLSSSPPWKNYNPPGSPDKVQRVRIRSTNVTSPGHYRYSPESEKTSPSSSFDDSLKHSDTRISTPEGYSASVQRPFNSSAMEDLNRTWPSASISDSSVKDAHLGSPRSALSVSAAKHHFEQMSSYELPQETERKSNSSVTLAPKPPSRTSSFRSVSSRLSSSSSVFAETVHPFSPSSSSDRQNSFSSHDIAEYTPTRKASSADDIDKPEPPKRFSQSALLSSFRSNKKPGYVSRTTAPSSDQEGNVVYSHTRTQSLPSSKIVATHLSSKSWVMNEGENTRNLDSCRSELLPRSSSFSRARVTETSSVQTVHRRPQTNTGKTNRSDSGAPLEVTVKTVQRDDSRAPIYAAKSNIKYSRNTSPPAVIQAFKTGEESSANENTDIRLKASPKQDEQSTNSNNWNKKEHNISEGYKAEPTNQDIYKPKPEVQPKSILKRELPKAEANKEKPKVSKPAPVLKENSLMQRLLMESQGQGGSSERYTAAAIEEEINQRTGKARISSRPGLDVPKTETMQQHERSEISSADYTQKGNVKVEKSMQGNVNVESKMDEKPSNERYEIPENETKDSTINVNNFTSKVDPDSPPVKHRFLPKEADSLEDDNVFVELVNTEGDRKVDEIEDQPVESNIDDIEDVDLEISNEERDVIMNPPSSELIVQSGSTDAVLESQPPNLSDSGDNITESYTPELQGAHSVKKTVETKYADTLSPPDNLPLKIIHSRDNSASSLLEETLESAKTIASIYSVEGPTRSPDGEDSVTTASEMRRRSLAKRVRRRPKLDSSTFTPDKTIEPDQSFTPETIQSSFSEPAQNENDGDDHSGNRSTGSLSSDGSRPGSGLISPKLEALEEQKEILISSMKKKVELLKEQESEINEEMKQNDELGRRVGKEVKARTKGTEYSKYELFVGELNNIIGLLLSLAQRMHRYEVLLQDIDLAEENGREERDNLLKRIDRVKQQYEEACRIKEVNDKRGETVSKIVEDLCTDEEFADFQHFVDMKTQLALTQAEIRDKIKLGEEKLNALTSAKIDWTTLDLSIK